MTNNILQISYVKKQPNGVCQWYDKFQQKGGDIYFVWYTHNNQLIAIKMGEALIQQHIHGGCMGSMQWQYILVKVNIQIRTTYQNHTYILQKTIFNTYAYYTTQCDYLYYSYLLHSIPTHMQQREVASLFMVEVNDLSSRVLNLAT